MGTPPSADFARRMERVANMIARSHPDPRVRDLITREEIVVEGRPSKYDYRMVRGAQSGGGVLVGYHVPAGAGDRSGPYITTFESGIKALAASEGVSIDQAISDHLTHELGHAAGGCPSGHFDCSPEEIRQTIMMGGELDPDQMAYYRTQIGLPQHVVVGPPAPWTYEVRPQEIAGGCG